MDQNQVNQSIFITNAFASEFPAEHTGLWRQFEKEVPLKDRSGIYGSDNVAYVRWLKNQNHPAYEEFRAGIVKKEMEQ
ncbi:hypothetical protein GZH47_33370 (plasmid) [Paenibacillus rhizovicinus]|uniref:Uncharacterized protein n=1 Tax=Paenibacillus rhizovicinus TaxID=2704463 RepID=A0A6C0PBF4_9BACL|nr:hypothetical protein [Paenibacillus rhizovicinus]QHW35786.1 hypothetical protein GZH47_33370 [Paenibacillus rhizovicinus]